MGSLYVVRHGQASFGQAEYDALSEIGRQQAAVLGKMLAASGLRFQRVLQGGMQRHQDTARLCLQEMSGVPNAETAVWLNEFDHKAVLRGIQLQDPKAFHKEFEKAMERWMSGAADGYPESFVQFKERCSAGVSQLLRSCAADTNVLLFTSGGPIARLMQIALEFADPMFLRLNGAIVNASLTRLAFKESQLFVSYFNDSAHFGKSPSPLLTYR